MLVSFPDLFGSPSLGIEREGILHRRQLLNVKYTDDGRTYLPVLRIDHQRVQGHSDLSTLGNKNAPRHDHIYDARLSFG